MNKSKKKMNGGSTNNFISYKNNSRRTYLSKKRGRELNRKRERSSRQGSSSRRSSSRRSSRRGSRRQTPFNSIRSQTPQSNSNSNSNSNSKSSDNTIIGISDFPSLFDSQNNNTATAINSLSPTPRIQSLEENNYRVKNTGTARTNFNQLRNDIKASKDINNTMFKFGKPTKLINNFLYSLYNENIICLEENTLNNNEALKTNMMMSVAELDGEPNTLYITISEEPITPTDEKFYSKMARLLLMIEIILFKGDYKSNRIGMTSARVHPKYENNNYTYANGRITILDIEEDNINKISGEASYTTAYKNFQNYYKDYSAIFKKSSGNSGAEHNDFRILIPDDLKIKFVFNTKYILERSNLGRSLSYRPFLKQDSKKPEFVACNSGSICSESKLFSYLHYNGLFPKVKGTIAYWVGKGTKFGKECHPKGKADVGICNYHPNYALEENNKNKDKDPKEDLLNDMIAILKKENKISKELLEKDKKKNNNNKKFKNVFRAFALPCPGCYLNAEAYKNDERILFDNRKCLENNQPKGPGARTYAHIAQNAANLHPEQ